MKVHFEFHCKAFLKWFKPCCQFDIICCHDLHMQTYTQIHLYMNVPRPTYKHTYNTPFLIENVTQILECVLPV